MAATATAIYCLIKWYAILYSLSRIARNALKCLLTTNRKENTGLSRWSQLFKKLENVNEYGLPINTWVQTNSFPEFFAGDLRSISELHRNIGAGKFFAMCPRWYGLSSFFICKHLFVLIIPFFSSNQDQIKRSLTRRKTIGV